MLKRRRSERPAEGGRGALVLDLRDSDGVADAVRLLERRQEMRAGDAAPGFLVQRQVGRKRELLVRVGEDAVFGPPSASARAGRPPRCSATWRLIFRR